MKKNNPLGQLFFYIILLFFAAGVNAYQILGIQNKEALKNVEARVAIGLKEKRYQGSKRESYLKEDILRALQPFGYFTPQIRITSNRAYVNVGLPVRIRLINLTINGPGRHIYNSMPKKLPIVQGEVFVSAHYEEAKQQLLDAAEQRGYLKARIKKSEAIVNIDTHEAFIHIIFDTGPRYYFGAFRFKRKTTYSEEFLRRYIQVKSGTPFSTTELITINEHFNNSGFFSRVVVRPHIKNNVTVVPVDIILHPKKSQHYSIGLGFGTDTGARGRLGVQLYHLNPYGHTLNFLLLGSQRQSSLQAQYLIPGKDPLTQQYHISARAFQLDYPVGKSIGQLFYGGFIYNKKNARLTGSLNLLNEPTTYTNRDRIKISLLYPSLELRLRHVNDPLFSKKGYSLILAGSAARKGSMGKESFAQLTLNAKFALWSEATRTRFFIRGELGRMATDDLYQLPLSLQLLAGGAESIRGYQYQGIGPGKKKYVVSFEVQQEIIDDWFVTAFTDRGAVYDPAPRKHLYSIGGGLMWASPIGPIKVGIANPIAIDKSRIKLIFSMGPDL